jgi:hypothetical protein
MRAPKCVACSAVVVISFLVAAPSASAQAPAGSLEGVWSGTATGCTGRGEAPELRLAVIHEADVAIADVIVVHRTRQRASERAIRARGRVEGDRLVLETRVSGPGGTFPADLPLHAALARPGALAVSTAVAGPAGMRCTGAMLRRTGDLPIPDPAPFRDLVGTWAGYDSAIGPQAPRRGQEPRLMPYQATRHIVIEVRDSGGRISGNLAAARPVNEQPDRQDRFTATLRATEAPGGGTAFEKVVVAGSGAFGLEPRHRVVVLAPRPDGSLEATVQHTYYPRDTWRFVLRRQSAETVAALRAGEGPAMPLPEALGGRLAEARSLDAQCRLIDDWANDPTEARFGTGAFSAVFGAAYDGAGEATLAYLGDLIRLCGDRLGDRRLLDRAGGTAAFLPTGRDAIVARSVAAEQAGERTAALLAELRALGDDPAARPRLAALGREIQLLGPTLSPGARAELAAAHSQAEAAIAAREGADTTAALLAELGALGDDPAARPRLEAIGREIQRLAPTLAPATRAELASAHAQAAAAIATRERADNTAALLSEVRTLDNWPEERATLRRLADAAARASNADLDAATRQRLLASVEAKTEAIVAPILSGWRGRLAVLPESLAGLDETRRLEAEAATLAREAGRPLPALAELRRAIGQARGRLIASETVQREFLASLANLRPTPDGRAAIAERAGRHYTPEEFASLTRSGPFARAIEERAEALERAAITVEDRSTTRVAGEPTAEEMLQAVKAPLDEYNAQIRETYARCERGGAQGNPILAMQCISVLATGGRVDARITRFSKLGCQRPEVIPGYICDYAVALSADHPMLGPMLEELGGGRQGIVTARFLRLDTGWQRLPLR